MTQTSRDTQLRRAAEDAFGEEIAALKAADDRPRPPNWLLSPQAVVTYLLGGRLPTGFTVSPKYIGDRRLMEIAVATLATDRALLLLGVPGTAKSWVSEHLAAAICGTSRLVVQGTAGTSEEAIRYGWNYALLLAKGPSREAVVASPIMRAMEEGRIARVEELTRIPSETQDSFITILSEKTLPIPELNEEVPAAKGFNLIATANNRDRGVNELSSALKRRFNTVVLPPPATIEAEIAIVETRVAALGRAFEIPAEPPGAAEIRRVVTIFREMREGVTEDGKSKVKQPSGTLSTAEAISVVGSGLALAAHFGDGRLSAGDLAAGIAGAVVKDPVQDAIVWREYLETVVKEREGWRDFYRAAREARDRRAMADIRIYGIRHHGPGSARSLRAALDALAPDCVLIEGPPDADALIPLSRRDGMEPPVALLVYRPDRPRDCAFFPFAGFSPEWVAMRHGIEAGAAVRFIDLPHAIQLADGFGEFGADAPGDLPADVEPSAEAIDDRRDEAVGPAAIPAAIRRDPLGELAQAAGYPDGERWWDAFVESRAGDASSETSGDVFLAIAEAMTALRETAEPDLHDALREEAREAHMRTAIRRAGKEGFSRVAVVCGAWHVPALLRHDARGQAAADAATLKGLPRAKVASAWAPWSYERLATASGYRAGVLSPEWYDLLWNHGDQVAARWLARAATLLRAEDLDASPASVIEAARLAEALAAFRGRARPSLEDLDEAAQATLCFADPAPMALIRRRLVVGERLGATPPGSPGTPVEADFAAQCRRLRLKPGADAGELVLDLRTEGDLGRSHLLNRLALIGIPWGERRVARGRGTFKEAWFLAWRPEWVVDLVAASADGGTVAEAAAARVRRRARETTRVADLSRLIGTLLDADLAGAAAEVIAALDDRAAVSADVFDLMDALPPLAELARYGSVRSADTAPVLAVVRGLVPRVAVGLTAACQSLDDEAAAAAKGRIAAVAGAVALLEEPELAAFWRDALMGLADQEHVHGRVVGRAVRLLFDARVLDAAEAGARLSRALSRAAGTLTAAAWIEGFLEDSGTALIHGPDLLGILDAWLTGLDEAAFTALLPLVRRTFATISPAERRAVGEALRSPRRAGPQGGPPGHVFDAGRAAMVLPILHLLLGPEPAAPERDGTEDAA